MFIYETVLSIESDLIEEEGKFQLGRYFHTKYYSWSSYICIILFRRVTILTATTKFQQNPAQDNSKASIERKTEI